MSKSEVWKPSMKEISRFFRQYSFNIETCHIFGGKYVGLRGRQKWHIGEQFAGMSQSNWDRLWLLVSYNSNMLPWKDIFEWLQNNTMTSHWSWPPTLTFFSGKIHCKRVQRTRALGDVQVISGSIPEMIVHGKYTIKIHHGKTVAYSNNMFFSSSRDFLSLEIYGRDPLHPWFPTSYKPQITGWTPKKS